jgi:glycylpeptide N-tetradecanoyltransferase
LLTIALTRRALKAPGWKKDFHVGVRASQSRRLVAFISAIPVRLRVRQAVFTASEVNFLVVHKKLRNKRLAPVLIKEVTRRSNLNGIWQGLYTGGTVLPTPVSTCRYYHRALDWKKLYEIGFSPLPPNSKPQTQIKRYALPDHGKLKGVREMTAADIDSVLPLVTRYLSKFDMAPEFDREDFEHWLLSTTQEREERVVWSYVVEVSCFVPSNLPAWKVPSTAVAHTP